MALQPEILKRMKKLATLPIAPKRTRLFSWPVTGFEDGQYRPDCVEHYDEWARITGSWPSNWRWGYAAQLDADAKRCADTGAKICLHVSPEAPIGGAWRAARDAYADRWHVVADTLDMRLVEVVYIDLEDNKHKPHDGTDATTRHNGGVGPFNAEVYRIAREFVGDNVQVRRYNHLDTRYSPSQKHGKIRVNRDTDPHDPVDGGFGCSMYYPMDPGRDLRNLALTIEEAKRWEINEGSAWVMAGCSRVPWLCPGLTLPYELVADEETPIYAWPYSPKISHRLGSLFGNTWWEDSVNGGYYRNNMHPPMRKVHSAVLFPGVFHPTMDVTAVHLVALLEGMSSMRYDPGLAVIQAEAVG